MGTITINIKDKIEEEFRKLAKLKYGKKKGYLGKALNKALNEWVNKKTAESRTIELLGKGIKMGKIKFDREDLHER
jgi:hypothetical protein